MKKIILTLLICLGCLSLQIASAAEVLLIEVLQTPEALITTKKMNAIHVYFANGTIEEIDLPTTAQIKGGSNQNLVIVVQQLNRFYSLGFKLQSSNESIYLIGNSSCRLTTYILVKE